MKLKNLNEIPDFVRKQLKCLLCIEFGFLGAKIQIYKRWKTL